MVDLDALTPREMAAGLMRGDHSTLRLGYKAVNAAMAAADYKKIEDERERDDLILYAGGFADGMADILGHRLALGYRYRRYADEMPVERDGSDLSPYDEGLADGRRENPDNLFPALTPEERSLIQRFPDRSG